MHSSDTFPEILPAYQIEPGRPVPSWIVNEAHLVNDALDMGVIDTTAATTGLTTDGEILQTMQEMVGVTYFVEYPPENVAPEERGQALMELFQSPIQDTEGEIALADYLAKRRSGVAIAMSTLDESTAKAIKYLNDKQVPVTAWVVLDDADGYWTNRSNIKQTTDRANDVTEWADAHELELASVGFDIEMPMPYIKAMANNDLRARRAAKKDYKAMRTQAEANGQSGTKQLEQLLHDGRAMGYATEVYTMPRFSKKGLLSLGGMDIDPSVPDKYIEMVYTSDPPVSMLPGGFAARLLRNKHAIPAFGIVSGDGTRPGRALTEAVGNHLSEDNLAKGIAATILAKADVSTRELPEREFYVFALNDPRVATMTTSAIAEAFKTLT